MQTNLVELDDKKLSTSNSGNTLEQPSDKHVSDINVKNTGGYNDLFSAIETGDLENISVIIENGTYVDCKDNDDDKNTPLHFAVNRCNYEAAESLIKKHGANVNLKNKYENTPLHVAASLLTDNKNNREEIFKIIQLLIDQGADVNCKNKDGKTPTDIATQDVKKFMEDCMLQTAKKNPESYLYSATISSAESMNCVSK